MILTQALRAKRNGIVIPLIAYSEAKRVGLEYAVACAVLMQESNGGHNVFGHDPTIFAGAGKVTKKKYLDYKVIRGRRRMQGVGPMQLTWWEFQDKADKIGGCWDPRCNCRVAFELLAGYIRQDGLRAGLKKYNGSEVYANQVMQRVEKWRSILR